jgi:hypothetical protein
VCKYACSEEVPEPVDVGGEGFCVAFDPLDGSSIVDTNFAVGTIFGVWPGEKLKDITGREQVRLNIVGHLVLFAIRDCSMFSWWWQLQLWGAHALVCKVAGSQMCSSPLVLHLHIDPRSATCVACWCTELLVD